LTLPLGGWQNCACAKSLGWVKQTKFKSPMKVNYNASDNSALGMAAADDNFKLLRKGNCNRPKPISEIQSVYCRDAKTGMHGLMCADCFGQVTVLIVDSLQESCNARFQTPDGDQLRQGVTSSWRLWPRTARWLVTVASHRALAFFKRTFRRSTQRTRNSTATHMMP